MMKRATVFVLSAVIAGLFMVSCNSQTEIAVDPQMGDQLVKELWDNLAANNTEAISMSIAEGFQADLVVFDPEQINGQATVANPNKLVVDVAGEASILMTMQEISTAVQYNLPIKIFILN